MDNQNTEIPCESSSCGEVLILVLMDNQNTAEGSATAAAW